MNLTEGISTMKRFACLCLVAGVLSSAGATAQSVFVHRFVQDNGAATFADTFSDGLEPPSGPYSGSDYVVFGAFGIGRESTSGSLEMNPTVDGSGGELVCAVSGSSYFFVPGVAGYLEAEFSINALIADTNLYVGIDNFQVPPGGAMDESVGAGLFVDSTNRVALSLDTGPGSDCEDITAAFGTTSSVIMKLLVAASGDLSLEVDFDADGTVELTRTNFGSLGFTGGGSYTGTFESYEPEPAPAPCASFCMSLPNATGSAALLTCYGDPGCSLVLTSSPVPDTPGQFFFGTMALTGSSNLGDGLRCVGGATTRLLPFVQAGMMMQAPNTASFALNYTAPYSSGLTGTMYFQHWYRSGLSTGTGSNTSDAIAVTF